MRRDVGRPSRVERSSRRDSGVSWRREEERTREGGGKQANEAVSTRALSFIESFFPELDSFEKGEVY